MRGGGGLEGAIVRLGGEVVVEGISEGRKGG